MKGLLALGWALAIAAPVRAQDAGTIALDAGVDAELDAAFVAEVADTAAQELAPATPPEDLRSLPTGRGLPVVVQMGVYFLDVGDVDENEGSFDATVDVRATWIDPRLAYPASEAAGGLKRIDDADVDAAFERMWNPRLRVANLIGEPAHRLRSIRIAPTGAVELLERVTGRFGVAFAPEGFPFDREGLGIEIVAEHEKSAHVALVFRQEDLDFSRASPSIELDEWSPRMVSLDRDELPGWHGDRHSRVTATLEVQRRAERTAPPVFIPLFASLLIPLLALWLNRIEGGEVKIEAFELANVIVGGLFAVIALNFTVNAEYPPLATGDNTVSRLFALNYAMLAISLVINLAVFRFRVMHRAFGPYVEEEAFRFVMWAVPVLAVSTAIAIVLAAAA